MSHPTVTPATPQRDAGQSPPMVQVTDLTKIYREGAAESIHACDTITFDVAAAEVVALCGPSGSGKSTLLYLIGGLDAADSGRIVIDGQDITSLNGRRLAAYRRRVGFVFQRFHLLPTLTAADNVVAPLLPFRTPFRKRDKAERLLAAVGLAGREQAVPAKLSGGQQQRVAIARALVNDPALVLADEPTGNLDSATGQEIVDLLFSLRDQYGTTLMIATHDQDLAARCDRVIQLRDGKIVGGG
jgi:putative ABC transport system ATP-binding protein